MESKERVRRAIRFEGPDRVPVLSLGSIYNDVGTFMELPPRGWNAPEGYYPYVNGDFFMKMGLWNPTQQYPKGWMDRPHMSRDEWGTVWEMDGGKFTTLGAFREAPIKDWNDLETWKAPDPHDQSRYLTLQKAKQLFVGKYTVGVIQYFGFTRLWLLRGFENMMMDFYDHPDKVAELTNRLADYTLSLIDEYHHLGADGIFILDDLGTQQGPFISPETFDRFLAELYARVAHRTHQLGMELLLHCCGRVNLLLPSLVEAGVDLFEFDSPSHTGIEEVADKFGGKVAFAGCPDIQGVFANESPDGIEKFIKRLIGNYGSYNGGFLYYEFPDWRLLKIPMDNIKAAMNAVIKWGTYPLSEGIKE